MEKSPVIGNIVDAFKILDVINDHEEAGVSMLAKELDLPKTRVFRIIKSLEEVKAIRQNEKSEYILDYRLLKYSKGINIDQSIKNLAEPHMKKVVELTGESVNLGIEYDKHIVFLNRIPGDFYQLQATLSPVGELYTSGMGKLFLSQWSDEELKTYFKELPKRTINTINSFDEFKKNQKIIKDASISIDFEEYEYGLSCYAAPIFDKNDSIKYAISISGPSSRLSYKGVDFITESLQECAKLIQQDLNSIDFLTD